MAAFGLKERLEKPPKYYRISDPGNYQYEAPTPKPNKVPFLSKSPRKTLSANPLWTDKIYDWEIPERIPNITSLKSTKPRFPYEALSKEDLEKIICRCGEQNKCECPISDEPVEEEVCGSKLKRRLYKGPVPLTDQSLPVQHRKKPTSAKDPPFYDARVIEATQFYHGWKWSQWASKRGQKVYDKCPGPADYTIQREPTDEEICIEAFRAHKRKTCRQLRFIEMIQRQNLREGRPGPADYDVKMPKGTDLQFLGPKADRFPVPKFVQHPGPADHDIRRDLDPFPEPLSMPHAVLPEPACFGVKARRFVPKKEEGPSPASYLPMYKHEIMHCPTAPFSSSAARFKHAKIEESDDEEDAIVIVSPETKSCPKPMWQFKSKTIRFKPLEKKLNESSPADFLPTTRKITRCPKFQHIAPFFTSQGRFQPWNTYLPIHGRLKTSHHGFLNVGKPKCPSAFNRGPLFRAARFTYKTSFTPGPSEYDIKGGVDSVLKTYNARLLHNIENQHKFKWTPPKEAPFLTLDQRYQILLNKSIALLDDVEIQKGTDVDGPKQKTENKLSERDEPVEKKKLLRFFLYSHQMPRPV